MLFTGINGGLTSLNIANNAGFAARFGNDESFYLNFGYPISGFLSNVIAVFSTYMSQYLTRSAQFIIYLVFSNIGVALHYIYLNDFFAECQQNKYAIDVEPPKEGPPQIELTASLLKPQKDQDYNKKFDKSTLTVYQNLRTALGLYIAIFLNFVIFIFVFPILVFQIDISQVVSAKYKFIAHNFLINIAAFFGNNLYIYLRVHNRTLAYFLVLVKSMLVVIIYFMRDKLLFGQMFSDWAKILFLLAFYFFNNYTFMMFLDLGQKFYTGKPYDKIKFGEINQYCIQIAAMVGALTASFVK